MAQARATALIAQKTPHTFQNTFTDFIACAEQLIALGNTAEA
jgi:protease II